MIPSAVAKHSLALVAAVWLSAQGCAGGGMVLPDRSLEDAQRQADTQIHRARAETEAIRVEMAATRIAAAKQEAEVQELRREIMELRQAEAHLRAANTELTHTTAEREQAQQQAIDAKEAELMALRAERDRLVHSAGEPQAKLTMATQPRQGPADRGIPAKLKELESTVALLTVEVAELKKRLAGKKAAQPSAALPSTTEPPPAGSALLLDAGQVLSIRVKPGDSLWGLARKYGVSLADLKAANSLRGDQLKVGQRLTIPIVRSEE